MRILLVEDEPDLAGTLSRTLEEAHFAVDVAPDGDEGLFRAREIDYGAIVLDVMLPGRDGWAVLEALRRDGRVTPVLLLTARDAVSDRVRGLNLGADDYLTKPFAVEELVARLRALERRAAGQPTPEVTVRDVRIDVAGRRVFRAGREVDLTGREFAILALLAHRRGRVVSRTTIAGQIYDDRSEVISNAIDVHVAALRRKLGAGLIETRRGLGYLIDA
ncbi:MAG: response regulator transcription factor [Vicinamibacterales bacterium]